MAGVAIARPRLQLALDLTDLPSALRPLQRSADRIDIIEVGTVLCLSEGMHAVRAIRALFPEKPILADIRIAEAGGLLARLAFEAGASLVSVVAGASMTTISNVCDVAREFGGEVQVELGETLDLADANRWREIGAQHAIVHRSRDGEIAGSLAWTEQDLSNISLLYELGFIVTVTGGVTVEELPTFAGLPVGIVIAGRAVAGAVDPLSAATELQDGIAAVWG